jgi:hypothetical protein
MCRFSSTALIFVSAACCLVANDAVRRVPAEIQGWRAVEPVKSYTPTTVYDYMDGGAEVYLSYGLKALHVRNFRRDGESAISLNIFEMTSAGAACGVFSFERVDGSAGIGQDSEYGAGILRFWHGSAFVFIQAEQETPACRSAILALGKLLVSQSGPPGEVPKLPTALPAEGLRPLSVRYVLSPQMLASMDAIAADNALVLPPRCEAVVGRFGKAGSPERVLIARYADAAQAQKGLASFLAARKPAPWTSGLPAAGPRGWSCGSAQDAFVVLVLDAADEEAARKRLTAAREKVNEVKP